MPPMNATGTNTAQMAKVVAITASPISLVPSLAAVWWSLPMARWRTMFSRTTMESSMSRPMHRLSAIMVMKFNVKPKAYTAMKLLITAIGRVSPVMMVLRQLCRNRNTIATVSSAPSINVWRTPLSESLAKSLLALMRRSSTSGGSVLRISSMAFCTASPTATMLASCCLKTLKLMPAWPLMRAYDSASRSRSTRVPRSASRNDRSPRRATTICSNCRGSRTRPSTRSRASCMLSLTRPTGWSALAWANAAEISAGVTP